MLGRMWGRMWGRMLGPMWGQFHSSERHVALLSGPTVHSLYFDIKQSEI